jgi:PhnB protein
MNKKESAMTMQTRNDAEIAAIRGAVDRLTAALRKKNAAAVIAEQSGDTVLFSMAPPLVADTSTTRGLDDWFATWDGALGYELTDVAIEESGALAFAYGLAHLTGTKTDGEKVDVWFRVTLGLRKTARGWTIVHQHESVPFYMDGSLRAAVDLKP